MATKVLRIEVISSDRGLVLKARLGRAATRRVDVRGGVSTRRQLHQIHTIIGNPEDPGAKLRTLRPLIAGLSETVLAPLADMFTVADRVVFKIDADSIRYAFDLLEVNGKPLFLQIPISYAITEFTPRAMPLTIRSGYFMADLTTDPGRGLNAASNSVPRATCVEMKQTSLAKMKAGVRQYDALVISAHGSVNRNNSGHIQINGACLDAHFMAKLNVRLTYLDSCQMGIAWDFLKTIARYKTSTFYIAPIASNEAGHSSTRTVTAFFKHLSVTRDPVLALALTRQALFRHYSKQKRSVATILYWSFVFRIYEFGALES